MTHNGLKEISIRNRSYYYLNELIDINHLDFRTITIDKTSQENIFMYYFRHKILYSTKPTESIIFIK